VPDFIPMPGYGLDPQAAADQEAAQRSAQEAFLKKQKEEQTKAFTQNFVQQRGLDAEQAVRAVQSAPLNGSPFDLKIKTDEGGVSSIGGRANVKFSPRIGLSFGGAYAPEKTATGDVMGSPTSITSPGQVAGQLEYRSPLINVGVEYTPRRFDPFGNAMGGGFSGRAGMNATW